MSLKLISSAADEMAQLTRELTMHAYVAKMDYQLNFFNLGPPLLSFLFIQ